MKGELTNTGKKGQGGCHSQKELAVGKGHSGIPHTGPWLLVTGEHRRQEQTCQKQEADPAQ